MSSNDTGSRRASPFARTTAASTSTSPDVPTRAPLPETSQAATPAPTPTVGSGRSSPFANRTPASATNAKSETPAPETETGTKTATTTGAAPTSRSIGRLGARPTAEPVVAPTSSKTATPTARTGGTLRGRAPKTPTPQPNRRAGAIRRDRPKTPLPPMPTTLPGTVQPKVKTLLAAMVDLVSLLVEENDALDRHDAGHVRRLMESKTLKTRYYQEQMLAVHANPRLLLELEEDQRAVMRTAGTILDTVVQENGRKLKANIEASNRLMKAVVNAVKEHERDAATTYSKEGAVEGDPTQAYRKAVTFNETL